MEWESNLSSINVTYKEYEYGTRCTSVILVGWDGRARFVERRWDHNSDTFAIDDFQFTFENAAGPSA